MQKPVADNNGRKKLTEYLNTLWRPMMAWQYFAICLFDFLIAPIFWSVFLATLGVPVVQWEPLTLKGAGLYHLAMGAILGITSWSRGQEKMLSYKNETFVKTSTTINDTDDGDYLLNRKFGRVKNK